MQIMLQTRPDNEYSTQRSEFKEIPTYGNLTHGKNDRQ